MAGFTELDVDVFQEILHAITDFATLSSVIRVSGRHAYPVYQAHKRTILYAVARNLIGPSLLQAFRLVFKDYEWQEPSADVMKDAMVSLTLLQRRQLEENHASISGLEDLFSQRFADSRALNTDQNAYIRP